MIVADSPHPRGPVGRRAGKTDTKEEILDAARDLFAEHGYEGASLRAIASRAGVDPGMIRHFFGDKGHLFAATMADRTIIPDRINAALPGPFETIGTRVTDAYLSLWEEAETRSILEGLVRSAMTSQHGATLLAEILSGRIEASAIPQQIDAKNSPGVILAAAHLFGVGVARNVLRVPPLAEMSHADVVAAVAPSIQQYLTESKSY